MTLSGGGCPNGTVIIDMALANDFTVEIRSDSETLEVRSSLGSPSPQNHALFQQTPASPELLKALTKNALM